MEILKYDAKTSAKDKEIAELKRQLDQLKNQQNRFKTIFESSDVAQKIIDHTLTILEVNQAMANLLGYTAEEIIGTQISDYTHPDFKEKWGQLQMALWHREMPNFQLEACLLKKDGTEIWCIVHTILFKNDDKTFGYTLLEDITVRKQLERHKDEFISVVAHELRTPLTTMKTQCQLLERELADSGKARPEELTKGLNKHINRLTRLIDNLLMVSKIDQGLTRSVIEQYDMAELIRNVTTDIRLTNPKREISEVLANNIKTNGDQEKVRQVLYNLINNAIKFSADGSTIDISLKHQDKYAVVCIKDYGDGIPEEDYNRIFKRFYQVNVEANRHLAGMGLGLYISDEIIRQQGGKLTVESEKGQGSTFCFTLPILTE